MDPTLIDRRPIWRQQFVTGAADNGGFQDFWEYEVVDGVTQPETQVAAEAAANSLATKLGVVLDTHGFDVIFFNRWTGAFKVYAPKIGVVGASVWPSFPEARKTAINDIVKTAWKAALVVNPRRRIGLYAGSRPRDDFDTSIVKGDFGNTVLADISNPAHAAYFHKIWDSLVAFGFDFYMADLAGGANPDVIASCKAMYAAFKYGNFFANPVDLIQEAIPTDLNLHQPDTARIYLQPSSAELRYVLEQERHYLDENDEALPWEVDGKSSEVSVWVAATNNDGVNANPATRAMVQDLMRRGFKIVCATTNPPVHTWAVGLARAPTPGSVAWVYGTGNVITWTAGTPVLDDLGVEIPAESYRIFRSRDGLRYEWLADTEALTYTDLGGVASDVYKVASWTEYNSTNLCPYDLSGAGGGTGMRWQFDGGAGKGWTLKV